MVCAAPHGEFVPEQIHMTEQEKTSAWTDGLSQKPMIRDLWRDLPPDGLGVQGQWLPHSSGAQRPWRSLAESGQIEAIRFTEPRGCLSILWGVLFQPWKRAHGRLLGELHKSGKKKIQDDSVPVSAEISAHRPWVRGCEVVGNCHRHQGAGCILGEDGMVPWGWQGWASLPGLGVC